jgi:hypothetical protein
VRQKHGFRRRRLSRWSLSLRVTAWRSVALSTETRRRPQERAREPAHEQVQQEHEGKAKAFSKLTERIFACREGAKQALEEFETGLKASEFS